MAKLIYSTVASLDGYMADKTGNFDWAAPDDELHAFVNDLERPVGTYLYGRRMYEVMRLWENPELLADESHVMRDFAAIWQAAGKVVYSRTLQAASTAKTQVEREFNPAAIRQMKAAAEARHHCERAGACRARDQGRIGRRAPAVLRADPRWWRNALAP